MRQHRLGKIKDIDDSKAIEVKSLDELFNYKVTAKHEKQNEYKDKFMSLFSELFFDLWD